MIGKIELGPCQIPHIDTNDDLELAWAAGFYDGEGSLCCTSNNGNIDTRVQLSIGQKDYNGEISDTLLRFQNAVGLGTIYVKSRREGHDIHQHQYLVCKKADVKIVINLLWPYLSQAKKDQANIALIRLEKGEQNLWAK